MRPRLSRLLASSVLALLTLCGEAQAHIVAARLGDFYAGALHPLSDPQDLFLWIGLALLVGSVAQPAGRWLVLLFPLGLIAGLAAGLFLGAAPPEAANAGTAILLGLLIVGRWRIPAAILFAGGFGLAALRGAANAGGVGADTNRALFACGVAAAGYIVLTLSAAAVCAFQKDGAGDSGWRVVALRALGGWIAAIGVMMGALALRA